jgi:TonB family protein
MTDAVTLEEIVRGLADHLWQSTLVAGAAALVCALLVRVAAQVRFTIWLVASAKFLVPFSLLTALGALLPLPVARPVPSETVAAWSIGAPFSARAVEATVVVPADDASMGDRLMAALIAMWAVGIVVLVVRRGRAVREIRAVRREATALAAGPVAAAFARVSTGRPRVALRASPTGAAPCVVGIRRPILIWPDAMTAQLSDAQIDAILAHEIEHVRHRHNLSAVAHGVVETLFWFHPVVWWIGGRLANERERVCDERVVQAGTEPVVYADAILRVCESSIGAPAFASARITGAALTHRIEAIMSNTSRRRLGLAPRALLVSAGLALVIGPVAVGAWTAEPTRALMAGDTTPTLVSMPSAAAAMPGQAGTRITGVVADQRGARVEGATVTARCGGDAARSTTTDRGGSYTIDNLAAGPCEVRVEKPAFKAHVLQIPVRAGGIVTVTANAELDIGSLSEMVTVSTSAAETPPAQDEARLQEAAANAGDDPSPLFALAAFLYRSERFAESDAVTHQAAELVARRQMMAQVQPGAGGVVKEPRKIRDVKPVYPSAARAAQVTGTVIIEARITEEGTVGDARILRGVPLLDDAALGAVRQWLFTPTLLNGVPIEVVMTATVSFQQR